MTINHYCEVYLTIKKTELKASTYAKYEGIANNKILPHFNDRDISTIKSSELRIWLTKFSDKSSKSLRHYISVLTGIFKEAYYDEVIEKNPCDFIRIPKLITQTIFPFTFEEVELLINSVDSFKFKHYLYIAFYTGLRSGEIIGLKKEDIDFERQLIYVKRSRGRFGESTPKTQSGIRTIPIFDILLPHLIELFSSHDKEYLFITQFGAPYIHNETFYSKHWLPLFKKVKIPYRRLYNTRHTFATMMLSKGFITPHKLAQILGHRDSQMVHQVYAKFLNDGKFDFKMDLELY